MRRFQPALLAVFLLAAPVALAQLFSDFRVYPPGPTNETPITVTAVTTCFPNTRSTVEKTADTVTIVYTAIGSCPSPPFPALVKTDIGTLAPGSYRIRYRIGTSGEQIEDAGRIHVRNARSPVPFDIHPFAVRSEPAGLQLRVSLNGQSDLALCATPDCSDITIRVGGVEARNLRRDASGEFVTFDAPPHAPGLVDVVIEKRNPAVTWTYPAALFYFTGPDLAAFERILFPVLFDAPGANGSLWRSQAAVSNPHPWFVENFNTIEPIVCITYPCGQRLAPNAYVRVTGGRWPQGIALLVPRVEADHLAFALRVRDESRQAEGFGTEVPVVREKDLVLDGTIRLLEVPLDPRYRVKLRFYAYDLRTLELPRLRLVEPATNRVKSEHTLPVKQACQDCPFTPAYAEFDLPHGGTDERVSLYIETPEGAPSWAFATVTNNATQQVTVVTPQ